MNPFKGRKLLQARRNLLKLEQGGCMKVNVMRRARNFWSTSVAGLTPSEAGFTHPEVDLKHPEAGLMPSEAGLIRLLKSASVAGLMSFDAS